MKPCLCQSHRVGLDQLTDHQKAAEGHSRQGAEAAARLVEEAGEHCPEVEVHHNLPVKPKVR